MLLSFLRKYCFFQMDSKNFWSVYVSIILFYTVLQVSEQCDRIVSTKYGPVKGITALSRLGRPYLSFRGIPYAKPPIGKLRFKVNQFNQNLIFMFTISLCLSLQKLQTSGLNQWTLLKMGRFAFRKIIYLPNQKLWVKKIVFISMYIAPM